MLTRWICAAALFCGCSSSSEASPPADAGVDAHKPRPGDPCNTRADCDDGLFCSGAEECLAGVCVSARNAACRAPSECATAICDEARAACVFKAGGCGAGMSCSIDRGCEANTCAADGDCDDGRACTDDLCIGGHCVHLPVDARCPDGGACGVGVCLGDAVSDPSGCGLQPDAAKCKPNEGCGIDHACVALKSTCGSDRDCADDNLCDGLERCVAGACVHGERTRCAAGPCEHAACSATGVGDPWCRVVTLARCP